MNKIRKVRGLLVKSGRDQRNAPTPAPLDWQAIRWRSVHKRVSQLRRRIFRAAKEGDMKQVSNLQRLMLGAAANRALSIRRVTSLNNGKHTPGIDQYIVKDDRERAQLYQRLCHYQKGEVSPVKRVYLPKTNGKTRPIGLPTIIDRCQQTGVKNALEPFWEVYFEATSYAWKMYARRDQAHSHSGKCPNDAPLGTRCGHRRSV